MIYESLELHSLLNMIEVLGKVETGRVARIVKALNEEEQDYFMGYMTGINAVLQGKYHVYINARGYERFRKANIDNKKNNVCWLDCPQILYYLAQEEDFHQWYILRKEFAYISSDFPLNRYGYRRG